MSVYPARTPSTLNTSPQTAETMIEAIETLVPVATGYLDAAFHFGIGVGFILFGHGAGPENGIEPDGIKRGCKLSIRRVLRLTGPMARRAFFPSRDPYFAGSSRPGVLALCPGLP